MENIFNTRVRIEKYACLVVTNDFSRNLICGYAVEKMSLIVVDHPCSYEMFHYNQTIGVAKQAQVSFTLGSAYKDATMLLLWMIIVFT